MPPFATLRPVTHASSGAACVAFLLLLHATAAAQLTPSGDIAGPSPVPTTFGKTNGIELFSERPDVTLLADMPVNGLAQSGSYYNQGSLVAGMLEAETSLSCHLLHYDPAEPVPPEGATGRIVIEDGYELLAVVTSGPLLTQWDDVCDPMGEMGEEVVYPTESSRGALGSSGDYLIIDVEGGTLDVEFTAGSTTLDQLRILVGRVERPDGGIPDAGPAPGDDGGTGSASGDDGGTGATTPRWDYRGSGGCAVSSAPARAMPGAAAFVSLLVMLARRAAPFRGKARRRGSRRRPGPRAA